MCVREGKMGKKVKRGRRRRIGQRKDKELATEEYWEKRAVAG